MKRIVILFIFTLIVIGSISAQMTVSGILDSTVYMVAATEDNPFFDDPFSCSIEEFANIRFQTSLRSGGTFFGAVNLIAAAGNYINDSNKESFVIGENYSAGFEIERLYFQLNGEHIDFDAGLMRLPFGMGNVWGPSDFLNPKNPLKPDARPRGILGGSLSWFADNNLKLLGFFAAPRQPFDNDGWLTGISASHRLGKVNAQILYSYEMPKFESEYGIHRAGLSLKADVEVSIVMDMLYTYNHEAKTDISGLSFSIGADYSFFDGNLIVLADYLYNGKTSSTAWEYGGSFSNNHYLYTGFTWLFSDFTNINIALISGFDDISFTPFFSLSHELFQGAMLTITAQIPMDRDLFSGDGNKGEFGPSRTYNYFSCSARLRLRF